MGRALTATGPSSLTERAGREGRAAGIPAGETNPPGWAARGYIRELDGLRGIAILLVMLHNLWPKEGSLSQFSDLATLGWIGVDLFFVISGFLITGILLDTVADRHYLRNFYARRALRIFPLYYLFLALLFLVIPRLQSPEFNASLQASGPALWYVLYLGNLRICTIDYPHAFLDPLWSVSIEEQFYLALPLAVAFLRRERLRGILLVVVLAAPLFRLVMLLVSPDNPKLQYSATFARMDELAVGALLAMAFRSPKLDSRGWPAGAALLGMIGVMTIAYLGGGLDRYSVFSRVAGYSIVGMTAGALVLWAVQHRGEPAACWLRWTPLCHLGRLCYGTYLFQVPVGYFVDQMAVKMGLASTVHGGALLLVKLAAAVLLAQASWWLLERNVLRMKKAFASTRHPSASRGLPPTAT